MNADNKKMMKEIKAKIKDMKFRAMEFMPYSKPSNRLWNAHTELMMEFTRLTDLAVVSPAVNDDAYFESKKIAIRSRILLKLDNILGDVFNKKDDNNDDYDIGSVCEKMRATVLGEACIVMMGTVKEEDDAVVGQQKL